MSERWISPLCPANDALRVDPSPECIGGKAASLFCMAQAGIPVPMTWVIPIHLCEVYYNSGRVLPDRLIEEVHAIAGGYELSRWAVRSGAAVSMPGTMESVLNCDSPLALVQAIRTVLDSWMSPAAITYRQAKSLQQLKGTAVILQQMVDTDTAGVMFSRDPLDLTSSNLIVEACPGLGDQLVSGGVAGQRWTVSRESQQIALASSDELPQALLTEDQLHDLTHFALRLEQLFGGPVDVEWGLANNSWVFFQARPITTAQPLAEVTASDDETAVLLGRENQRLAVFRQRGDTIWVRHNLCETIPFPTPLTWSILRSFLNGSGGYGSLYRQLGFSPGRRIQDEGFVELIAGQIYASPHRLPDIYCEDFPFSFDKQALLQDPSAIDRAPSHLDLDRVGPWFLLRSPWIALVIWRSQRRMQKIAATAQSDFERSLSEYHDWISQERSQNLGGLSFEKLIPILNRRIQRVLNEFAPQLLLPGVVGATLWEKLNQRLAKISSTEAGNAFCQRLLQRFQPAAFEELNRAIAERCCGQLSESDFMRRFGHRCFDEMELAQPRWLEDARRIPTFSESELPAHSVITVNEAGENLRDFLSEHGATSDWSTCAKILEQALSLLPLRETGKSELMRGYALVRETCEAMASVSGLGADLYFLSLAELSSTSRLPEAAEISNRKQEWRNLQSLPHPAVIDDRGLIPVEQGRLNGSIELRGNVISPGNAVGIAWFPSQHSGEPPPKGAVLVSPTLPPHFVSLFASASAIVVDQSAMLSHGAILVRQFRIPTISHREATQLIREGDQIHVDAHSGVIQIIR